MIDVHTEIEPPGLDFDEDDDGEPHIAVHVGVFEPDETRRAGCVALSPEASDDDLAEALIACVRGAAAMRGPGLVAAVNRRLR